MKATPLSIPDVIMLEPKIFGDSRGCFFESYNRRKFLELTGRDPHFVQDNHSVSTCGVLRGLHYQLPPMAQGKLVRVTHGQAFDVAVDIRKSSSTFGKWVGAVLSGENRRQLWIPEGFAHGFLALSDHVDFLYKVTEFYSADHERCIKWDDDAIDIEWPYDGAPVLSSKDQASGVVLHQAECFD